MIYLHKFSYSSLLDFCSGWNLGVAVLKMMWHPQTLRAVLTRMTKSRLCKFPICDTNHSPPLKHTGLTCLWMCVWYCCELWTAQADLKAKGKKKRRGVTDNVSQIWLISVCVCYQDVPVKAETCCCWFCLHVLHPCMCVWGQTKQVLTCEKLHELPCPGRCNKRGEWGRCVSSTACSSPHSLHTSYWYCINDILLYFSIMCPVLFSVRIHCVYVLNMTYQGGACKIASS